MTSSLRTLLAGIIDYAGMFPPTRLPLDQAIRNYVRYRREPERWLLGRFVCPASRLAELAPFHEELFQTEDPFSFSALGRGGNNTTEFLAGLRADLDAIAAFRERHGERVLVTVYEARLPPDIVGPYRWDAARPMLRSASDQFEFLGPNALNPYYEISPEERVRASLEAMIRVLSVLNEVNPTMELARCGPAGLKSRCGGLEASAFPKAEQVAFAITQCRDEGVALKFTAGLHHPIWHFDAGVQTYMHGFINVFVAGVLAHAHGLGEDQVRRIIQDKASSHFLFEEANLGWKNIRATIDEIALARQQLVTSFGSCSFEEPLDDLRNLGWLD